MTTSTQLVAGSLDTAIPSGSISSLASGGYAIGSAIDNRPGSGTSYDLGDLRIPVSSVTPTAGTTLQVAILPAVDGGTTNYASPNAAAAPPLNLIRGTYVAPGGAITELAIVDVPLLPYSFKVLLVNNLGVAITASANVTMTRKTIQNV